VRDWDPGRGFEMVLVELDVRRVRTPDLTSRKGSAFVQQRLTEQRLDRDQWGEDAPRGDTGAVAVDVLCDRECGGGVK
jgi:hypothetical protein